MMNICLQSNGGILLSFDESLVDAKSWKELYDPDINQIIGYDGLPPQIWR
jgi:hypothetical protein